MRIHTAQILVFLFIGCLFLLSSATNFDSEGPLADAIRNRKTKMEGKNRARNDQTHPGVWHDLVGKDGDEAVNTIKSQHPGFHVITVPHNGIFTMDFRTDRVRVLVDEAGKVVRAPMIG